MIPAWLSYFDGLLAVALVIAGPLGAHFALATPFFGFQLFLFGLAIAVFGLLLGLIGLWGTRGEQSADHSRAMVGSTIGGLLTVFAVVIVARNVGYAPINDITTDVESPPVFVKAAEMPANRGRDLAYDKAKLSERQKQAYADLGPLTMRGHAQEVFEKVKAAAEATPGWTITYSDSASGIVEGVVTSALFRFQDDFAIKVRADSGDSVRIDMRSKSRDGISDLGVNAARIHSFFQRLSGESSSG